jgi:hypothetical protein
MGPVFKRGFFSSRSGQPGHDAMYRKWHAFFSPRQNSRIWNMLTQKIQCAPRRQQCIRVMRDEAGGRKSEKRGMEKIRIGDAGEALAAIGDRNGFGPLPLCAPGACEVKKAHEKAIVLVAYRQGFRVLYEIENASVKICGVFTA